MSEERARLFVALELPEDVRAELAAWAQHIIRASPAAREAMADSLRAVPADSLRAVPAD